MIHITSGNVLEINGNELDVLDVLDVRDILECMNNTSTIYFTTRKREMLARVLQKHEDECLERIRLNYKK